MSAAWAGLAEDRAVRSVGLSGESRLVSESVKIRGDATPRFPARCICCLDAPAQHRRVEWRFEGVLVVSAGAGMQGKVSWNKTVTIPGIPYCRDHAARHDAHVAWGEKVKEYEDQLRSLPPMPRLVRLLYVFIPAGALAVPGAIMAEAGDADPMLGVLGGLSAGMVVGTIALAVSRGRKRGHKMRELGPPPAQPSRVAGEEPKIRFSGRALGLDLKAKADAASGDLGVPRGLASVWISKLFFKFDNPEYARLFDAENNPS